ncbi:DUF817 domain-containing protein [Acidisoma silvae]|uniref:DUF817 domain-containing protein n=1 Tax=Acidisoma silvae TaxID=2802396 RepID=A0A964DX69_9PROT|nr:DUF817 domain-containing protein [Acidisoma silvae]MCB8873960.1 DUF817 domain-containing protein [Acidisoma silvae]
MTEAGPVYRSGVGDAPTPYSSANGTEHSMVLSAAHEFLIFGLKQAWACLFGGALLVLIVLTRLCYPAAAALPRYDALFVAALAIQIVFLVCGLESLEEAGVILAFHLVGTLMELFKTSVGSWHYPEVNYIRVAHVPLFTGFMYAAVGSYLFRIWRIFDFDFAKHPRLGWIIPLSGLSYANFYADHWALDFRYGLIAAAIVLFGRTTIYFTIAKTQRHMPLLLGFALVTLFIWLGENIGTAGHIWLYPDQVKTWVIVSPAKLTSWFLLMLISYTMVAIANARWRPH